MRLRRWQTLGDCLNPPCASGRSWSDLQERDHPRAAFPIDYAVLGAFPASRFVEPNRVEFRLIIVEALNEGTRQVRTFLIRKSKQLCFEHFSGLGCTFGPGHSTSIVLGVFRQRGRPCSCDLTLLYLGVFGTRARSHSRRTRQMV